MHTVIMYSMFTNNNKMGETLNSENLISNKLIRFKLPLHCIPCSINYITRFLQGIYNKHQPVMLQNVTFISLAEWWFWIFWHF